MRISLVETKKGIELREGGKTFAVLPLASRELAEAMVRFGLTRSQILWLLYND